MKAGPSINYQPAETADTGPVPEAKRADGFFGLGSVGREIEKGYENLKRNLDFKKISLHGIADVATLGMYGSVRNLARKPIEKWSLDDVDIPARFVKGTTGYDIAKDPYYRAGRDVAIAVVSAGVGTSALVGTTAYKAYERGKEVYDKGKEIQQKAEEYKRGNNDGRNNVDNGNYSSNSGSYSGLPQRQEKMISLQNLVSQGQTYLSQGQTLLAATDSTTASGKGRNLDPTAYVVDAAQNVIDSEGWNWLIYAVLGYMAYKALT